MKKYFPYQKLSIIISIIIISSFTKNSTAQSVYKLPFPNNVTWTCTQGNNNPSPGSHNGMQQYAFDFGLPIGSTVCAMRKGKVTNVVSNYQNGVCHNTTLCGGNCKDDFCNPCGDFVNRVVIEHDDGTRAQYLHLNLNSVFVSVGDSVAQGQVIALSGNSGCVDGVNGHLHVMLMNACSSSYFCQSIQLSFCDFSANNGVPILNSNCTAGNCNTISCPTPTNDLCGNAIPLTPASTYSYTPGSVCGVSPISTMGVLPTCGISNVIGQDVWYKFEATQSTYTLNVQNGNDFDAIVQVLSQVVCGSSYTEIACNNSSNPGVLKSLPLTGLTIGNIYWIRIFNNVGGIGGTDLHDGSDFQICVTTSSPPPPPPTIKIIPVVVHVMHTGEAEGTVNNPSDAEIIASIDYMNTIYNGTAAGTNLGVGNTNIQFALAKRDPNNNCTNGITRTNLFLDPYYGSLGVKYDLNGNASTALGMDDVYMKDYARWDPAKYINIWLVNKINGNSGDVFISTNNGSGYVASLGNYQLNNDGIVMKSWFIHNTPVSSNVSMKAQLSHEMGHMLDLRHVFEDGSLICLLPILPNCNTSGDLVCDTDPVIKIDGLPPRTGTNLCTLSPYNDYTERNIMSYTTEPQLFTPNQKTRMLYALDNITYRTSLVNTSTNNALIAPLADLIITNPTAPVTPINVNTMATVSFSEKNIGGVAATSNYVNIHLSYDGELTPGLNGDIYLGQYLVNQNIAPNVETSLFTAQVVIPATATSNNYYLFFAADAQGQQVTECYEDNNFATAIISIVGCTTAPASTTSIAPGTAASPGTTLTTLTPTFNWNTIADPNVNYRLAISKEPYGANNLVFSQCVGNPPYTLPTGYLQGNTNYRWDIQTNISCGTCEGGYSADLYFNTTWLTTSLGLWTWMSGDSVSYQHGVYGTLGIASATNMPGPRIAGTSWADNSGNLWLMGGFGLASGSGGYLNDLWRYNISSGQWTWMGGDSIASQYGVYGTIGIASANNHPGARAHAISWKDNSGNLWLMGGYGYPLSGWGALNDLWKYNISLGQWTWMGGDSIASQYGVYGTIGIASANNHPGARERAISWKDNSGNLWLMGGYGFDMYGGQLLLNDLWKYDVTSAQWTCMGGTSQVGIYGNMGIASASNQPGARSEGVSWADNSGNLWLMGGYGYATNFEPYLLNDIWKYNITSNQWTWMGGSNLVNQYGVYGSKGIASASNQPRARKNAIGWTDNSGNLWMMGGIWNVPGTIGYLNDLWKYSLITMQWTWIGGSDTLNQHGVYGTMGISSVNNIPGSRHRSISFSDSSGNLWLMGGYGYSTSNIGTSLRNDLWKYSPILNQLNNNLNLKLFLEGYYIGANTMTHTLMNEGENANSSITDTILVELRNVNSPYSIAASTKAILNTNGTATCIFPSIIGNYYIAVKHRNGIQSWSKFPVAISSQTAIYDFTTAASKAYGNNQSEVESGVWAMYSGDLNYDENIDLLDLSNLEFDVTSFNFGYFATDINGDGNVDLLDAPVLESNVNNFIFSNHP